MWRIEDIRWGNGDWWPLLLLPLLLIPLYVALGVFRRRVERGFSGRSLVPAMLEGMAPWRRFLSGLAVILALEALTVACLRPRWGLKEVTIQGTGLDVCLVLDASRSMKTPDVSPDRLTAATVEISRLMEAAPGHRWALVPFAGLAFIQSPLTVDTAVVRQYLADLQVTDIPVPGTAIGRALAVAASALGVDREDPTGAAKVVVLFTDGENHEGDPQKVADALKEKGVRIYTVGVGTPAGQPLPILDDQGAVTGTAREADGTTPILSKLNEDLLRDMATRTGGTYLALTPGSDVAGALAQAFLGLQKADYQARVSRLLEERYGWPLGVALVLMMVPFLLAGGAARRKGALLLVAGWTLGLAPSPATARPLEWPGFLLREHPDVRKARKDLEEGRTADAVQALKALTEEMPGRADLWYDLALAQEAAGDLDPAIDSARKALATLQAARQVPRDWPSEARMQHLLGTLLGRKAMARSEAKDPPRKVRETWREAVAALTRAVLLDPSAQDSRRNLELASDAAWPPCSRLDDSYEPNPDAAHAQFLPVDPNTQQAREDLWLCPGDEDWFRFPMRAGETIFVSAVEPPEEGGGDGNGGGGNGNQPSPARVDLTIRSADGTALSAPGKQARFRADGPDPVLVQVTGPREEDGLPYRLEVRLVPPCPAGDDGMEPNDTEDQARPVEDGDHGLRACPGNEDWFQYTEKQGTRKDVSVSWESGEGPLEVEVVSADGARLEVASASREGREVRTASLPKAEQEAPFRIHVRSGRGEAFYQLSIRDGKGGGNDSSPTPQAGSQALRDLLESVDRNEQNLEAQEATRKSPWKDRVPDKDW
ncbi:MAG TPA: VWA domain-containing protein [Myxococcota bacterium]|nr:VWA domain-containing protein [Myxococcota bacterium]HQK51830.1 VWA domain-containing protein [Myxococcota bacterium]